MSFIKYINTIFYLTFFKDFSRIWWAVRDSNSLSVRPIRRVYTQQIYSLLPLTAHYFQYTLSKWRDSNSQPPPWQGDYLTNWYTLANLDFSLYLYFNELVEMKRLELSKSHSANVVRLPILLHPHNDNPNSNHKRYAKVIWLSPSINRYQ